MSLLHPSTLPAGSRAGPVEPPRTLAALIDSAHAAGAKVHALAADAETLGLLLPMFGRVSATTAGPHALLSDRGGYGPVRLAGQAPMPAHGRIHLRLTSGRGEHVVMTPADPSRRRPAGLHLFAADGTLCHRAEIAAPEDLLLLAGLCQDLLDGCPEPSPGASAQDPSRCDASIPQIRRAQSDWQGMGEIAHLDTVLLDGGAGRLACLRHLGAGLAQPVPVTRIAPFLHHLAGYRLAFRRIVPRPGCLQAHSGAAELVPTGNGLVLLRSKASLFALDGAAIAGCWLTRWERDGGHQMVVEIYGHDGLCLALLAGPTRSAKEAGLWNRLAGMLAEN